MTYKNTELLPGDLVCYRFNFSVKRPGTIISAAVRFFTKCWWNHTALIAERDGKLYLNEAVAEGVVSRPLEEALVKDNSYLMVLRPHTTVANFSERAMSRVGYKYDYWSLLFYQLIYRTLGIWLGKTSNGDDTLYCSEYAAWLYDMYKWWLLSTKEIIDSDLFYTVLSEKPN